MGLKRIPFMIFALRRKVSAVRLFRGIKQPEIVLFASVINRGSPPLAAFSNAHDAGNIVLLWAMNILHINGYGRFSEICQAVVRLISVTVVNLQGWPFSEYVKPCQPMSEISLATNRDVSVAIRCGSASNFPRFYSSAPFAVNKPRENTSFLVVVKAFAQAISGYNFAAHFRSPGTLMGSDASGLQARGVAPSYHGALWLR